MPEQTYYTFNLQSGIAGLQRAITHSDMEIEVLNVSGKKACFNVTLHGKSEMITMEEFETRDHPLARLGKITGVVVKTPDDEEWAPLKSVLVMAFLRGGG